jgi:hypothetical protein
MNRIQHIRRYAATQAGLAGGRIPRYPAVGGQPLVCQPQHGPGRRP